MTWKESLIAFGLLCLIAVVGIDMGSGMIGGYLVKEFPNSFLTGIGVWLIGLSSSITLTLTVILIVAVAIVLTYAYIMYKSSGRSTF